MGFGTRCFFVGKKHDGETLGFPSTKEISSLGFVYWDLFFVGENIDRETMVLNTRDFVVNWDLWVVFLLFVGKTWKESMGKPWCLASLPKISWFLGIYDDFHGFSWDVSFSRISKQGFGDRSQRYRFIGGIDRWVNGKIDWNMAGTGCFLTLGCTAVFVGGDVCSKESAGAIISNLSSFTCICHVHHT